MKLNELLNEETTSGSVAGYVKPLNEKPLKRIGFMNYVLDNECKGCKIIKNYAFQAPNSSKEITCAFCGAVHKRKG